LKTFNVEFCFLLLKTVRERCGTIVKSNTRVTYLYVYRYILTFIYVRPISLFIVYIIIYLYIAIRISLYALKTRGKKNIAFTANAVKCSYNIVEEVILLYIYIYINFTQRSLVFLRECVIDNFAPDIQ